MEWQYYKYDAAVSLDSLILLALQLFLSKKLNFQKKKIYFIRNYFRNPSNDCEVKSTIPVVGFVTTPKIPLPIPLNMPKAPPDFAPS